MPDPVILRELAVTAIGGILLGVISSRFIQGAFRYSVKWEIAAAVTYMALPVAVFHDVPTLTWKPGLFIVALLAAMTGPFITRRFLPVIR